MRLDLYLVENNYFTTRSKAALAIKEKHVKVNDKIITKAGFIVSETDVIEINQDINQFVSRGGIKLLKALQFFRIDLTDKTVLDIGASTGGFTDCCLQNKAGKVYAYDVGHSQLDKSLLNDSRVVVKEKINCRYLTKKDFEEEIDFICLDVSFISCTRMFEAISDILNYGKETVILFKPQFEAGKDYLNRQGIVINDKIIEVRLNEVIDYAKKFNLKFVNKTISPVKGKDGNKEYLLYFIKN
ncbi:MAG: TlyA family RNA methyltransferase [Erysipelotrichaceae bacterium]|jgi:23S rRNA (cytidine1920-2'-O)/16S rRNA (cytidine1409-2'-O)-methyltransferase